MSEVMALDDRLESLRAYWQILLEADPACKDRDDTTIIVPPDEAFFAGSNNISVALSEARNDLRFQIGCLGHRAYRDTGLADRELRDDSEAGRLARAWALALLTAPLSEAEHNERTHAVAGLLTKIVAGEEIHLAAADDGQFQYPEQQVAVNTDRRIYGVLNGHVSGRALLVQYDRPDFYGMEGKPEYALRVPLPAMFEGSGILLDTAAA
jgi:hypothetical protein